MKVRDDDGIARRYNRNEGVMPDEFTELMQHFVPHLEQCIMFRYGDEEVWVEIVDDAEMQFQAVIEMEMEETPNVSEVLNHMRRHEFDDNDTVEFILSYGPEIRAAAALYDEREHDAAHWLSTAYSDSRFD